VSLHPAARGRAAARPSRAGGEMRNAFFNAVFALAREDERIVLRGGDLGFRIVEGFMAERPKQVLNAGIAEQNMMSMAAG
ncbi:hypothetical protein EO238_33125, partial [Citrobacter sp. AAK_AS5]